MQEKIIKKQKEGTVQPPSATKKGGRSLARCHVFAPMSATRSVTCDIFPHTSSSQPLCSPPVGPSPSRHAAQPYADSRAFLRGYGLHGVKLPLQRQSKQQPLQTVSHPPLLEEATSQLFAGAEVTLKRFWKSVGIESRDNGLAITLDKRPLRTPGGKPLLLPQHKRLVAALIATEWENQETLLKPHALPVVRMLDLSTIRYFLKKNLDFSGFTGH